MRINLKLIPIVFSLVILLSGVAVTYSWYSDTGECELNSTINISGEEPQEVNRTISGAPAHFQCSAKNLETMFAGILGPIMLSSGLWFTIKSIIA